MVDNRIEINEGKARKTRELNKERERGLGIKRDDKIEDWGNRYSKILAPHINLKKYFCQCV